MTYHGRKIFIKICSFPLFHRSYSPVSCILFSDAFLHLLAWYGMIPFSQIPTALFSLIPLDIFPFGMLLTSLLYSSYHFSTHHILFLLTIFLLKMSYTAQHISFHFLFWPTRYSRKLCKQYLSTAFALDFSESKVSSNSHVLMHAVTYVCFHPILCHIHQSSRKYLCYQDATYSKPFPSYLPCILFIHSIHIRCSPSLRLWCFHCWILLLIHSSHIKCFHFLNKVVMFSLLDPHFPILNLLHSEEH